MMSGRAVSRGSASVSEPEVWVETSDVDVAKAAIDMGWRTIVTNVENGDTLTEQELQGERSRLRAVLVVQLNPNTNALF